MKYGMVIACALAGAMLAACGRGDDAEEAGAPAPAAAAPAPAPGGQVADSFLAELNAMAAVLESVETEADAQRAAEEIAAAAARLQALGEANEDFLGGAQGAAMFLNRAGDFMQAQQRLGLAMDRLQTEHPELADTVGAAMNNIRRPGR